MVKWDHKMTIERIILLPNTKLNFSSTKQTNIYEI